MSNKMDRQGARSPADLEYRYLFGKTFAEIMGVATDARNIAIEAKTSYEGLNQEEIFNRLTNNGEWEGLYEAEGKVYINASYIKSGSLDVGLLKTGKIKSGNYTESADGTAVLLGMSIDLDNGIINSPKFKLNASGEITATGGDIGGFMISEDGLTKTLSYTGDFARECEMIISPSAIGTSTVTASNELYSATLQDGLLLVRSEHSSDDFNGTLAYYFENSGTYRVFIDPDTNTVKAEITSPPIIGG